jgi:agmatinase
MGPPQNTALIVKTSVDQKAAGDTLTSAVSKGANCYISLDMDVLDLSLVPGCVSAEPDGMLYAQLRDTLIALTNRARIVGFDLVEVNPQLDVGTGVTSYLAAHTIVEFLGHLCDSAAWKTLRLRPDPSPSG